MPQKKDGYIQLPPIPENTNGMVVQLIWEYARLPENEQKKILDDFETWISDGEMTEGSIKIMDSDQIERFRETLHKIMFSLFCEARDLAATVSKECFIDGRDIEDLMSEAKDPKVAEAIQGMYQLFLKKEEANTNNNLTS